MYQTWPSFDCVVGTCVCVCVCVCVGVCVRSCFLKQEPWVCVRVSSHIMSVYAKCGGQNSQTIRVYAPNKSICTQSISLSIHTLSGRTGSALVWHSEVARSRLTQCSKFCDLQHALQCAIRGTQGVLPCVGCGVRPVNWIYRFWRHCP